MKTNVVLTLIVSWIVLATSNSDYDGFKIYDVRADNPLGKSFLKSLSESEAYDFFSFPKLLNFPVRVMVKPEDQNNFERSLNTYGINFNIINYDVAQSEDFKQEAELVNTHFKTVPDLFNKFQRFDDINAYLELLVKHYPERVYTKQVGRSYEGRHMKAIIITNGDRRADKNVIFVDAGIHAREWIAPATALYIINQLTENVQANTNLLKDYDWVVLPVVNPDGYEYSHTTSRYWRKTRKPVTSECTGTDGNRNFNYHWGDAGASKIPCMDDYMGTKPFSEPETQVVRDIMHSLKGRAKMYLTLHSFGNYLLYPWGFTEKLPSTWKDLDEVAQAGAAAIKAATGTKYTVGSSTNVLYEAAGGSDDYAFGKVQIPISITMELPAGGSGFNPLPVQIKPLVQESWIGIKAMAETVIKKYKN